MRKSTLKVMLAAVLVLAAVVLLLKKFSEPAGAPALCSAGLPSRAVRFEISGPKGTSVFSRSAGGTWIMDSPFSYTADRKVVDAVMGKLPEVRLSGILSTNPSALGLFGLEESGRTRIALYSSLESGKPELEFYSGKEGTSPDSFFIAFPGKNGVAEAGGLATWVFEKSPEEWLDKTVMALAPGKVTAFSVRHESTAFSLTRSERTWIFTEKSAGPEGKAKSSVTLSAAVSEALVSPMLEAVSMLEAEKTIPAEQVKKIASREILSLEVTMKDGTVSALKIFPAPDKNYSYAKKPEEKRVCFMLPEWKLSAFKKSPRDFK
ncbi:MAG: DUF4340 domain-containing protein [bacterium]